MYNFNEGITEADPFDEEKGKLNIQMSRGVQESSEFVTKRLCFSVVLSVAFLTLVGGFWFGQFTVMRKLDIKAERTRQEFAGNGLESTEFLQSLLLKKLEDTSIGEQVLIDDPEKEMKSLNETFAQQKFLGKIVRGNSSIAAIVRGSREPDRIIIVSVSKNNSVVMVELIKAFEKIYLEYYWRPQRTVVFCVFFNATDYCQELFNSYDRFSIMAVLNIADASEKSDGGFQLSGSDLIKSTVLKSSATLFDTSRQENTKGSFQKMVFETYIRTYEYLSFPRLKINLPHARLSFSRVKPSFSDSKELDALYKKSICQVMGLSIWRLSDSVTLKWVPNDFLVAVKKTMQNVRDVEVAEIKEEIKANADQLKKNLDKLNSRIDKTTKTKLLDVRIVNDLSMHVENTLLCLDEESNSQTDLAMVEVLQRENVAKLHNYLIKMNACYEKANDLLQSVNK